MSWYIFALLLSLIWPSRYANQECDVAYGLFEQLGTLHVVDINAPFFPRSISSYPAIQPYWSPDGENIAFFVDYTSFVYLVTADGEITQPLFADGNRLAGLAWAPDSQMIALTSDYSSEAQQLAQIYIISLEGEVLYNLGSSYVAYGEPSWSPDGNSIAYRVVWPDAGSSLAKIRRSEPAPMRGIYIAELDASEAVFISQYGRLPTWSPNGEWLMYQSHEDERSTIYLFNIRDETETIWTYEGTITNVATWSPDSRYIAFILEDNEDSLLTHIVPIEEPDSPVILSLDNQSHLPLEWSPDSRYITTTFIRGAVWIIDVMQESAYSTPLFALGVVAWSPNCTGFNPIWLTR